MAVCGSCLSLFIMRGSPRYYTARIARLRIHGDHRRLREEIELRSARPGVCAHRTSDDEVAGREPREHEVLRDHIDAIARRAGEHRGQPLPAVAQRLDRVARMIVELTAEGPVQPVIEVVPPVALALRAPHHRCDAYGSRTDD